MFSLPTSCVVHVCNVRWPVHVIASRDAGVWLRGGGEREGRERLREGERGKRESTLCGFCLNLFGFTGQVRLWGLPLPPQCTPVSVGSIAPRCVYPLNLTMRVEGSRCTVCVDISGFCAVF